MIDIKKLLTNMMDSYRAGEVTMPAISANGYSDYSVQFGRKMKSTPSVAAIRSGVGTAGYTLQIGVLDVSSSGFKLRVWNYGSGSVTPKINWVAVVRTE